MAYSRLPLAQKRYLLYRLNLFSKMSDKEVLLKIHQGDEKALEYLYKKYYSMIIKMILKNQGNEQEAKDIFQEALIIFWQKSNIGQLTLTSKISTYLYSVCLNLWRKELKRKSRLSWEEKDGREYQQSDQKESHQIIHQCIESLGETCQKVLTYYYFDRMSMQEIAVKLGFSSTDTAKTKKYKCKKKLDQMIKANYSESDFLD